MTLKHINKIGLDKSFFVGGNATFSVKGPERHYTFKITTPPWNENLRSAFLLSGPDNTSDYVYLGMVNKETGAFRLTEKSKMTLDTVPVKVLVWILKHAFTDGLIPDGYAVNHDGNCGCCGRPLTVPLSVERGIGPDCWARLHGGR